MTFVVALIQLVVSIINATKKK